MTIHLLKRILHTLVPGALCLLLSVAALAQPLTAPKQQNEVPEVPDARATLALLESVADWQLAHPSAHRVTDWTQGVGDAGMMALAMISGQAKYRESLLQKGASINWALGPAIYHADDQVVGQTYLDLYLQLRDRRMIAPLQADFDFMLAHPSTRSLEFISGARAQLDRWSWCDALFMGPPTWARLSAVTGDPRYLDFAVAEWWRTSDYLYDPKAHLYYRDSRYFEQREANGQRVFWGRGNGWVMGALVRMLQFLPAQHAARARFETQFKDMAQALLAVQQADGLWRASLLDPASYPLQEASGSSLITYGLAWGVNAGLLDRAEFSTPIRKAWRALSATVDADGKATHIQPIGASPKSFDAGATEVYGVGALLLAGSEIYRMALLEQASLSLVTVSNPLDLARSEEMIELPWRATDAVPVVLDVRASRQIPAQFVMDKLIFQVDLAPGETRNYHLLPAASVPAVPTADRKTDARFVPERLDDFAWENDRIAHRMYGPALMQDSKEKQISSGVDVWVKSVRTPVLQKWYAAGDYHVDHGEGLDNYRVGATRGCGGISIFSGKSIHSAPNFKAWKLLANGPLRSLFELEFPAFSAKGRSVTQTLRISIDAGSHFSRVESQLESDQAGLIDAGVGIARRVGGHFASDVQAGWMSYWEPELAPNGHIACAVIMENPAVESFTVSHDNFLALARPTSGQTMTYYLGAAWSKSGDFASPTQWQAYVADTVRRQRAPLQIKLEVR